MHKSGKPVAEKVKRRGSKMNKFRPIPDRFNVSLKYTSRSQVSGTSFTVYNFDLTTLQTLQPSYRDQLLAMWQQYVVLGVTISAKIVNKSTTVDAEVLEYHGDGYTISALTFNQALEYKHTVRRLCTTSGNGKTITINKTIWLSRYLPKNYASDSEFWGNATSGPAYSTTRGYQHAIAFIGADPAQTISVTMDRRITFHVRFFELAAISNSLSCEEFRPLLMNMEDQKIDEEPENTPVKGAKNSLSVHPKQTLRDDDPPRPLKKKH